MTKTLTKIGNSRGIILDRTMLEHLGVAEGGMVEMTMEAGRIVITSAPPEPLVKRSFEEAKERTLQRYSGVLRRLADAGELSDGK